MPILAIVRRAAFIVAALATLWPAVSAPVALAAGIVFALVVGNPFAGPVRRASGWLLKSCVVGLGFGLSLAMVLESGLIGLWLTGLGVVSILVAGLLLARAFGLDRDCGRLIAAGTAICGGSAIAAVAPAIGARSEALSISLGCVFVLNAAALYLFPWIGGMLDLTQSQFAWWAAIAIHDTSSVVGAASGYGDQALAEATVLKLARALWIVPLVVVFMVLARRDGHAGGRRGKITWPLFVALFIAAAGLRTALPAFEPAFDQAAMIARRGLVLTLFLIGSGFDPALLRTLGWRPLVHAGLLWLLVSSVTLGIVVTEGAVEIDNSGGLEQQLHLADTG